MPFPLKIQPVDFSSSPVGPAFLKPAVKSRFKRLFERPFGNVLRITGPEKPVMDDWDELEPSSACLTNMVKNFIEDSGEKQHKCCQGKCYCFNNSDSDDEFDSRHTYVCQVLKKLVMCSSVSERNLLADSANIVSKFSKCKIDEIRKTVTDDLLALGYDASICKSRWERAPTYPAGEYDYVDVIKQDERLIVDIDFRAEFTIARSTKKYNAILQILPHIFVGKADRLQKIVYIVSDAAKQSLKKNGMPFPPWRRADYVKSKWLSPYTRTGPAPQQSVTPPPLTIMDSTDLTSDNQNVVIQTNETTTSPVIAGVESPASSDHSDTVFNLSEEEEAK
ncbi:Translation initiation factor IF-2 [Heracleum sosnowskyi]|uniref:Translation initiation factor IF-2 n=1 Tax=Heracleum sosnowskyi TaxID=360622 RepID=A0AAD8N7X3_9APIA|nr:Translation initiation factor IF-2 [Heracleum sosnowskyi]